MSVKVQLADTVEAPFGTTTNPIYVAGPMTTGAGYLATTVAAGSLVISNRPASLYGFNVVAGASAGFLMIFNATSAPADGTVTPAFVIPLAANAGIAFTFPVPERYTTGITMVFSTTGPFTKTVSATAFMAGQFS